MGRGGEDGRVQGMEANLIFDGTPPTGAPGSTARGLSSRSLEACVLGLRLSPVVPARTMHTYRCHVPSLLCPFQVLIEVAQAIQHLHSLKLIHCDIKPENVLLKSDGSKPIGFVTKLSDFGLAKLLRENYYIVNRSGSGTVTHLAPELFQVGSKLTTSVDTFSFGIMMWCVLEVAAWVLGMRRTAVVVASKRRRMLTAILHM